MLMLPSFSCCSRCPSSSAARDSPKPSRLQFPLQRLLTLLPNLTGLLQSSCLPLLGVCVCVCVTTHCSFVATRPEISCFFDALCLLDFSAKITSKTRSEHWLAQFSLFSIHLQI
ncbi:hypothetical protein GOP47_0023724 [Adiantum capillus-veneris]|uniref:Uncharacterized protein n=1 Tax=Adiantum capillus-veneris TaxID=13818 RepID=A0A9D4U3Z9_ADICA|nr:hypothetical protein GOP47_0023724 [Adiantum capillus-veneris]